MFQHCQPLNLQNKSSQPQLGPAHHFLTGQSLSHHLNNWLRWQCLSWQPNLLNFTQSSVQPCKIEEPEPTYQQASQSTENPHLLNPDNSILNLKPPQTKEEEQDINAIAQKKALYLTRKEYLNQVEMDVLKQYRSMRVLHYLSKKEKRTFEKKIVYATRKRVADKRIRYKGKFINEIQAKQLLGLSGQEHSFDELKCLMKQLKSQS